MVMDQALEADVTLDIDERTFGGTMVSRIMISSGSQRRRASVNNLNLSLPFQGSTCSTFAISQREKTRLDVALLTAVSCPRGNAPGR
jgi:hypothetical protein